MKVAPPETQPTASAPAAPAPDRTGRRRLRGLLVVVTATAVVAGGYALLRPGPSSPSAARRTCVYAGNRLSVLRTFAAQVGFTPSCAEVFNNAAPTWAALEHPWFLGRPGTDADWSGWVQQEPGRSLVITQALIPDEVGSDWRTAGAAGAYDGHIRTLARALVGAGLGSSVIRLAHEANGTWTKDGVGDGSPAQIAAWRAYWRRFVTVMRSVPGARFRFDWCVNAWVRPIPFASFYPGDDVVDIVGIDAYDFSVSDATDGVSPATRWSRQYHAPGGLGELSEFARAHDKPLSIPEWGLAAAGGAQGGIGDNPTYVDRIGAFVRDHRVAYQAYFMARTDVGMLLGDAPSSLARYRAWFGRDQGASR